MKRIIIYSKTAISILFFLIVFSACSKEDATLNQEAISEKSVDFPAVAQITKARFQEEGFRWVESSTQQIPRFIRAAGRVDVPPENRIQLTAMIDGYIRQVKLIPGDRVEAGQVLLHLENPAFLDMQQEYLQQKAAFELAETDWQRKASLYKDEVVAERQWQQAKATMEQTKAAFQAMAVKLPLLGFDLEAIEAGNFSKEVLIKAPVSGVVTSVHITNGVYAPQSTSLIELVKTDHLHLELEVFEAEAALVQEGQALRFRLSGQRNSTQSSWSNGEVFRVNASLDETNRSINVHAHVADWENPLIGAFVEAEIEVDAQNLQMLPVSSVWQEEDRYHVFILAEDEAGMYQLEEVAVHPIKKPDSVNENDYHYFNDLPDNLNNAQILSRRL
jgi:cobalt-zinc-cadmium efflux system membrane fusion protein